MVDPASNGSLSDSGHDAVVEWLGRAGYAAKGFVYALVGILAALKVADLGGELTGTTGALSELQRQPFGVVMLFVMALGLIAYSGWRWSQALLDVENKGSDAAGIVRRAGLFISGGLYLSLAWSAIMLASGASQSSNPDARTAEALSLPGGLWLVIVVGAGFMIAGLYQLYRAYATSYEEHWRSSLSGRARKLATQVSRFGIAARAIVFLLMSGYLILAAVRQNPEQTKGLGGALSEFAGSPLLLGTFAAGLICYGLYSMVNATYRRIPANN